MWSKRIRKTCTVCGAEFEGTANGKYCRECRPEVYKNINLIYEKTHRRKRTRPETERTCKKCGNTFMGKYCQRYCYDCLHDGTARMTQYLKNRRDSDYDDKEEVEMK